MTDKLKPVDLARARLQHHREQVKYWAGRLHTAERNAGLTRRPRLPSRVPSGRQSCPGGSDRGAAPRCRRGDGRACRTAPFEGWRMSSPLLSIFAPGHEGVACAGRLLVVSPSADGQRGVLLPRRPTRRGCSLLTTGPDRRLGGGSGAFPQPLFCGAKSSQGGLQSGAGRVGHAATVRRSPNAGHGISQGRQ